MSSFPYKIVIILSFFFLTLFANANNDTKKFTKTIKQYYYDKSNEEIIRLTALKKLQMELSKEVGEYISTNTIIKNSKIQSDEIIAISASILKLRVLNELITIQNGKFTLELKVETEINARTTHEEINKILESQSLFISVQNNLKINNNLLQEIEKLKLHEKKTKDELALIKKSIEENIFIAKSYDFFNLTITNFINNDYNKAIFNLEEAIKLNPKFFEAYGQLGGAYAKISNYEKAIEAYEMAIKINKNDFMSYYNLGTLYYKYIKNPTKAIEYFSIALRINPFDNSSLYNLGTIYFESEDYNNAIIYFNKLLEINPNHQNVLVNKCAALMITKKLDNALESCNQALSLNDKLYLVYKLKARIYNKMKDYDKSIAEYEKYENIFPDDFQTNFGLASNLFNIKNYTGAIKYYSKVISLNPNFKLAYYSRALCYLYLKDFDNAEKDSNMACKFGMCDLVDMIKKYR